MKILYVATIGGFMPFFKKLIRELLDEGHSVDIATNMTDSPLPEYYKEWGCGIYQISCSRSPLNMGNLIAIKEIKKIVTDNRYDIVHCHTPLAAMCTRIACRKARRFGTRVIYTAHGFHFYKGAPAKNWLIFCTVEKMCARWTDTLITINKEDYAWATYHLKIKHIEYVPGVGIDVDKFVNTVVDRNQKRKELGIPENVFLILSVGELNENKNHQVVLNALAQISDTNIHYAIAGKGGLQDYLLQLADQLDLKDRFHLLGYRSDVNELYKISNAFALPSIREGLNVSTMEAMASGLPCIVSNIRGNVDMVDKNGGSLCNAMSVTDFVNAIHNVQLKSEDMSKYNRVKAKMFAYEKINKTIKEIYYS